MDKVNKRLGEILVEHGFLSRDQLRECLEEQRQTREYLGSILLKKRLVKEEDFIKVLAEQFGLVSVSLRGQYIDWNVCSKFSKLFKFGEKLLPFFEEGQTLTVAIVDPLDVLLISEIEKEIAPVKLRLVLVSSAELKDFLQEYKKRFKGVLKNLLSKE